MTNALSWREYTEFFEGLETSVFRAEVILAMHFVSGINLHGKAKRTAQYQNVDEWMSVCI